MDRIGQTIWTMRPVDNNVRKEKKGKWRLETIWKKKRNGAGGVCLFSFLWVAFSYYDSLLLFHKKIFLPPQNFNDVKLHRASLYDQNIFLFFCLEFSLLCFSSDGASWKSPRHHMSDILFFSSIFFSWCRQTDRRTGKCLPHSLSSSFFWLREMKRIF